VHRARLLQEVRAADLHAMIATREEVARVDRDVEVLGIAGDDLADAGLIEAEHDSPTRLTLLQKIAPVHMTHGSVLV
jgi:hypothetical protein